VMSDGESVECPLCGLPFPISVIERHAATCDGAPVMQNMAAPVKRRETEPAAAADVDPDYLLALKLQAELDAESAAERPTGVVCGLCNKAVSVDQLYILDECSHRFCRPCIKKYVAEKVATSVNVECPTEGCKKNLSVRDMKDLIPRTQREAVAAGMTMKSSKAASQRLAQEMRHIMKSKPEENGYSIELVNDNMYLWEVRFFNFDAKEPIAKDMARARVQAIVMHISFPSDYPFSPPFCRIIRPRFEFHTGHVTIGGSICMELLTRKGWSPENTVEALCMSIRSTWLAGGARLDTRNKQDYTEAEAKEAFDRLVRQHGWQ